MMGIKRQKGARIFMVIAVIFVVATYCSVSFAANTSGAIDIKSKDFKLIVCDGPDYRKMPAGSKITINGIEHDVGAGKELPEGYVPCDFEGLMKTIQRLINVAMVAGVLIAIFGFCYAGYTYIVYGDNPQKRSEASSTFRKVFFGFIIMLSAWFIVYQILSWLTGDSGFTSLLKG